MNSQAQLLKQSESKAGAGFAGAGSGTFLVLLADSFPDSNPFKVWLKVAAPSASVVLSILWLWCQVEVANYMRDRKLRSVIRKTKTILEDALNNPQTSEGHRNEIREKLQQLELTVADRELARIQSLAPITASDIQRVPPGMN
jgi:hypothetical protein